jgi:hypothetical protein
METYHQDSTLNASAGAKLLAFATSSKGLFGGPAKADTGKESVHVWRQLDEALLKIKARFRPDGFGQPGGPSPDSGMKPEPACQGTHARLEGALAFIQEGEREALERDREFQSYFNDILDCWPLSPPAAR